MPIYRIILIKLKPGVTKAQKKEFVDGSHAMKGVVPGIISLEIGPPQDMARTHGFDFGIVLCLEDQKAFEGFATHSAHLRLHNLRESMCEDSLAYNLVF